MKPEDISTSPAWKWRCSLTSRNRNSPGNEYYAGNQSEGQQNTTDFTDDTDEDGKEGGLPSAAAFHW